MDIEQYELISGVTVTNEALYNAAIRRSTAVLENMLGYTLDPTKVDQNLYNEEGKSQDECACSNVTALSPPDPVVGAYRLFPYDETEEYLHIDPFTEIHAVKLVKNNVTIKTFDLADLRIQHAPVSRYIEVCKNCFCYCSCKDCIQIAVDGDWLWPLDGSVNTFPDDLLTVWADFITYDADCKSNVKSESIGAHSYTKFTDKEPWKEAWVRAILLRYAGPWGTIVRKST